MIRMSEIYKRNLIYIKNGLEKLKSTTHLIQNQIEDNIKLYEKQFNENKFKNKIGNIKSFLGSGVFGAVFSIDNNKVFKLTFDFKEAPFLKKYCLDEPVDGFVKIDRIYKDNFGHQKVFYVIRDNLQPITEIRLINEVISDYKNGNIKQYTNDIQKGVAFSINQMLKLDPNWRITHYENFAIQNETVVLYDGFSKNIVPSIKIEDF